MLTVLALVGVVALSATLLTHGARSASVGAKAIASGSRARSHLIGAPAKPSLKQQLQQLLAARPPIYQALAAPNPGGSTCAVDQCSLTPCVIPVQATAPSAVSVQATTATAVPAGPMLPLARTPGRVTTPPLARAPASVTTPPRLRNQACPGGELRPQNLRVTTQTVQATRP